ncbi:DUF1566 domain-containing protein [candidate division WWE3 bacterium]|nr:DUF1566 domain-containing protein [candidate division WWE3 bacterium]MBT7350417.1 DUF1566 domain-containing protein [candidate division WWE3 bacterium]
MEEIEPINVFDDLNTFDSDKPAASPPDTGQNKCYNNDEQINCLRNNKEKFFGQDANYSAKGPDYKDNKDGTITDNVTGLMWQKDFDIVSWADASTRAKKVDKGGYPDWRVPTVKELYSIIDFSGTTGTGTPESSTAPQDAIPFIDTRYFDFEYAKAGRFIDAQYITSTEYVSTTMEGNDTFFGVNFADGRIKGYPKQGSPNKDEFYVRYVRGNKDYKQSNLSYNGDGTITDNGASLMWMEYDSERGMVWEDALAYCEDLSHAGLNDWRLPNAKELQSIVDYTRSPDTTDSPAIAPIFGTSYITNEKGEKDYPFFWTGTTHVDGKEGHAVYIAFGRALGFMNNSWLDVHGAGAQRSDPKTGNPGDYPQGRGPQGDAIRIYNNARCTRDVI